MWPTTVPSFITAIAKASTQLPASLSHGNSSHGSLSLLPQLKNSLDHQPYLARVCSASSTEAWQHDTPLRGVVNSPCQLNAKIKTAKISSGGETGFSRKFGLLNFPLYGTCDVQYSLELDGAGMGMRLLLIKEAGLPKYLLQGIQNYTSLIPLVWQGAWERDVKI